MKPFLYWPQLKCKGHFITQTDNNSIKMASVFSEMTTVNFLFAWAVNWTQLRFAKSGTDHRFISIWTLRRIMVLSGALVKSYFWGVKLGPKLNCVQRVQTGNQFQSLNTQCSTIKMTPYYVFEWHHRKGHYNAFIYTTAIILCYSLSN